MSTIMKRSFMQILFITAMVGGCLLCQSTTAFAQTDILLQLRSGSPPGASFNLDREASDNIDIIVGAGPGAPDGHVKVIDGSTGASVTPHVKVFAGQTGQLLRVYQSVRIAHTKRDVIVKFANSAPLKSPKGGQPVKWTREDGAKFELRSWLRDGTLVQTLTSLSEKITRTYSLSDDGNTLTIQVEMTGPTTGTFKLSFRGVD